MTAPCFFLLSTASPFVVGLGLVQLYRGCRVFDGPQTTLKMPRWCGSITRSERLRVIGQPTQEGIETVTGYWDPLFPVFFQN